MKEEITKDQFIEKWIKGMLGPIVDWRNTDLGLEMSKDLESLLQNREGKELRKSIENSRDDLYNQLPTGEVHAFELVKVINSHIEKLDSILSQTNNKEGKEEPQPENVRLGSYAREIKEEDIKLIFKPNKVEKEQSACVYENDHTTTVTTCRWCGQLKSSHTVSL